SPARRSARAAIAVFATSFPVVSSATSRRTYEGSPPSCPHPPSAPCTEASHLAPFSTATLIQSGTTSVPVPLCRWALAGFSPLLPLVGASLVPFGAQIAALPTTASRPIATKDFTALSPSIPALKIFRHWQGAGCTGVDIRTFQVIQSCKVSYFVLTS